MGTRVFHSFHRVFHIPPWKRWLQGAAVWKSPRARTGKKRIFLQVLEKIPQNGFPCRPWRKNTGFSPFLSAFLFEISGKLWYNANILCQNRSFGPGPGHPGGPFSKGKGQVAHLQKEREKRQPEQEPRGADIIAGRNAVSEALRAGRTIDSLYIQRGERSGPFRPWRPRPRRPAPPSKRPTPASWTTSAAGPTTRGWWPWRP